MPCAAFGLKKYLSGTSWVVMTSNNVDATSRLGDSEVLAVKYPPRHAIPEFDQRLDDDSKISSLVRIEKAWNVLEDDNPGTSVSK